MTTMRAGTKPKYTAGLAAVLREIAAPLRRFDSFLSSPNYGLTVSTLEALWNVATNR